MARAEFKTEDTFLRGFLYGFGIERIAFTTRQKCFANFPQHLDEIRAGAAARIKHEHARVSEAVGNLQFLAQRGVHAGDLILHNFRRRVPDTHLFAQFGIEGFKEWFVEILDGVVFHKPFKERGAIHAV